MKDLKQITPRNPVVRSPLLRRGGAHVRSKTSERRAVREQLRDEAENWREEISESVEVG